MDTYLERVSLRFHQRLLRYHRKGLAWCIEEEVYVMAFYHALCVGVEELAIAHHKRQIRRLKGGRQ